MKKITSKKIRYTRVNKGGFVKAKHRMRKEICIREVFRKISVMLSGNGKTLRRHACSSSGQRLQAKVPSSKNSLPQIFIQ